MVGSLEVQRGRQPERDYDITSAEKVDERGVAPLLQSQRSRAADTLCT